MKPSERSFARRLDLTTLQLFAAVCEHGSIGKAEAAAGTALLYRHARGVSPTPAGEAFLHHARSVLLSLDRMQGDLLEYAEGVKGHVRIHANISAIVEFLPEDIGAFAKLHPQIKIDLQEHLSSDVIRAVHDGAADVGICNQQADLQGLASKTYRQDKLVAVLPRKHALSRRKHIAFVETLDFDHVGLHSTSALYLAQRRAAAAVGKQLQLRIQVTSLDAMCRMIHNGLGVGVMPDRAFELVGSVGDLIAVPLTDAWSARDLLIVSRDFDTLPAPARLLVEHLLSKT
jgi:DNA-binding transcriptional LysR family regulator